MRAQLSSAGYRAIDRTHLIDPTWPFSERKFVYAPLAFANRRVFVLLESLGLFGKARALWANEKRRLAVARCLFQEPLEVFFPDGGDGMSAMAASLIA
jgi:hypothetical protein